MLSPLVAARRRRAARRTAWAAWAAAGANSPDRRALSAVRDLVAPLGIRAGRPLVTRWLGGALDPG